MRLKAIMGTEAPLYPLRLWAFAAESQQDGDFSDYSDAEIATICECSSNAQALRQALLQAGFLDESGHLHDWAEHNEFHSNMAERARNAANARWGKTHSEPLSEKEKEITKHCLGNAQAFENIWKRYPKRIGKKKAKRSFDASVKTKDDLARIETALMNYLKCKRVADGFIQDGSTWFNNWQDWMSPNGAETSGPQKKVPEWL